MDFNEHHYDWVNFMFPGIMIYRRMGLFVDEARTRWGEKIDTAWDEETEIGGGYHYVEVRLIGDREDIDRLKEIVKRIWNTGPSPIVSEIHHAPFADIEPQIQKTRKALVAVLTNAPLPEAPEETKGLRVFDFEQKQVRSILHEGQPWFVAKDVCDVLELSDVSMSVSRLDDDEKGTSKVCTPGGSQAMTIINESGAYALILRSNKPQARRMRKWLTSEVLPALHRTGRYDMNEKPKGEVRIEVELPPRIEPPKIDRAMYYGVFVKDGAPMVSSHDVARVFGMADAILLGIINRLNCSEEWHRKHFGPVLPGGQSASHRLMTYEGFILLIAEFRGKYRTPIKEEYLKAWHEVRSGLNSLAALEAVALPTKVEEPMELEEKTYSIKEAAKLAGLQPHLAHRVLVQQGHVFKPREWLPYRPSGRAMEEELLKLYPYERKRGEVYGYRVTEKGVDYLAKTVPY